MQSVSLNLTLAKSQNGLTFYATPFSPSTYWVALPDSTDIAIAIPLGVDSAIVYYSAGATVAISQGLVGDTLSAPTATPALELVKINPPTLMVSPLDDDGNSLYLHLFSPNSGDWAAVAFFNSLGYFNTVS